MSVCMHKDFWAKCLCGYFSGNFILIYFKLTENLQDTAIYPSHILTDCL